MRIGIIGAGTVFPLHARAYRDIGASIAGVADIDEQMARRAAARFSILSMTTDWRELVQRDDVDVVDICTPPGRHKEIALMALEAGKHVLCEKPLTHTLSEADAIVEAAQRAHGQLIVLHQFRATPQFLRLKWLIDGGHLGRPRFVRAQRYDGPPMHLVKEGRWGQWETTGGGVLMTKAVHELDLLLWLLGPVRRVRALMDTLIHDIEAEDHAIATLEFANGAIGSFVVSGRPGRIVQQVEIIGDRGMATTPWSYKPFAGDAGATVRQLNQVHPLPDLGIGGKISRVLRNLRRKRGHALSPAPDDPGHTHFLRAALQSLKDGSAPPISATEARNVVELVTAIYASAITREAVELPLNANSAFYTGISKNDYDGARRESGHVYA